VKSGGSGVNGSSQAAGENEMACGTAAAAKRKNK